MSTSGQIAGGASGSTSEEVSAESVRAQLSRIVESRSFANAPRLCRLLIYLVEQSQAGNEAKLRESAIGVEVFDRGATFDPSTDTIVRVHARRLRHRLEEYYDDEGRSDPVVIDIPKGHYQARFRARNLSANPVWTRWRRGAIATAITVTVGAALYLGYREDAAVPPAPAVTRFQLALPPGTVLPGNVTNPLAISRDGRRIAFNARGEDGENRLYVRELNHLGLVPIEGVEGGIGGVWFSPDGEWIAFNDIESASLRKVPLEGGAATTVAPMGVRSFGGFSGLAWGPDGTLIFATHDLERGLMRVPDSGGRPEPFTQPADGHEHHHPHVLADGSAVLFTLRPPPPEPDRIVVRSLETGAQRILTAGASPRVTSSGDLLFAREGTVWVAPLDLDRLALAGKAVPVLDDVAAHRGIPAFDVAGNGSLVYLRSDVAVDAEALDTLVWVGLDGSETPLTLPPGYYDFPSVSPDGKRIALRVADEKGSAVWIYSLERHTMTRLTFGASTYVTPAWSPDGKWIIYAANHDGTFDLYRRRADGAGEEQRLTATNSWSHIPSWSRDGEQVIYVECHDGVLENCDIGRLNLGRELRTEILVDETLDAFHPQVSPDGRWLAYMSHESRKLQIFVRPYPNVGAERWQISSEGGEIAFWSADGKTLYYADTVGEEKGMMAVAIDTDPEFVAHAPQKLFDLGPYRTFPAPEHYAFDPGGERFLVVKRGRRADTADRIVVMQNWLEEVNRLARN